MHEDDPEGIKWFKSILLGDSLQLFEFGDICDTLGLVKVVEMWEDRG
jgi:hypothetical protein